MKYEYFYDGESYYLINEFALEFRTSLVIKWNGNGEKTWKSQSFIITQIVQQDRSHVVSLECHKNRPHFEEIID